jgi:hypothetical protein
MKTITYVGVTRLLDVPIEADGKTYPFAYDTDMPEDLQTSYRILPTSAPNPFDDLALAEMIEGSRHRALEADLERTEGRRIMWITIHPDPNSDASGAALRAQCEKGPDLELKRPHKQALRPPPGPPAKVPDLEF